MPDNKKTLTPSKVLLFGTVIKNPILVQVIGLCPAVAASSSLTVALLLSFVTTFLLIICEVLASAVLKPLSSWFRVAVYMIIGLLFVCPLMYILDGAGFDVVSNAGIYLPLMAANSVVALRCEKFAVKRSVALSFYDAFATGLGVSVVLILSGFVRELLGTGTIAGHAVFETAPVPALTMPFGGFIVLGFSAAFLKWFISVFLAEYSHDMVFKIKKTSAKRPSRTPEKAVRPVSPTQKGVLPPTERPVKKSVVNSSGKRSTIPVEKESFADVFYNSMSDDIFTEDDVFDNLVTDSKTDSSSVIENEPSVTADETTLNKSSATDMVAQVKKPDDEAEQVIIPVDLDLVEEDEIRRALSADDEGGHDE